MSFDEFSADLEGIPNHFVIAYNVMEKPEVNESKEANHLRAEFLEFCNANHPVQLSESCYLIRTEKTRKDIEVHLQRLLEPAMDSTYRLVIIGLRFPPKEYSKTYPLSMFGKGLIKDLESQGYDYLIPPYDQAST